jgi:hypothetical protein
VPHDHFADNVSSGIEPVFALSYTRAAAGRFHTPGKSVRLRDAALP